IEEANGAGRPGLDRGAPWIAADAEAAERGAVVAAILGKDLRPAGDHAGEDEGLVVRLAAAVDEEALSQIAGGELGKLAGQEDATLGQHLRRDTRGLGRLPLNRLDDLAIAVAEVAVEQLRQEVEIAPALAIEEADALAVVELEDGLFALLDGPGHEQVLTRR